MNGHGDKSMSIIPPTFVSVKVDRSVQLQIDASRPRSSYRPRSGRGRVPGSGPCRPLTHVALICIMADLDNTLCVLSCISGLTFLTQFLDATNFSYFLIFSFRSCKRVLLHVAVILSPQMLYSDLSGVESVTLRLGSSDGS
jgi:hypothetical protein